MHRAKFRQELGYRLQIFKEFQHDPSLFPLSQVTTLTASSLQVHVKRYEQNLRDCSDPWVSAWHLSKQHLDASHQCIKQHD